MTAAWSEMLPDRRKSDRAAWVQLGLALIGFGALAGSVTGAAFGWARSSCWCCWDVENEEPL